MNELDPHINRINTKLLQLIKQYQLLEKENAHAKAQLAKKLEQEAMYVEQINMLEQKVSLLKAATGQLNAEDKLALEKNISKHLKEIDRCITFLSE